MADGVDIDLYADDLESDFVQVKDEFCAESVDLYDDVIAPAPDEATPLETENSVSVTVKCERTDSIESNGGYHHVGNNLAPNHIGRRYQLYIGNLTWWTTDQDITSSIHDIGVSDFQEVKFFENRSNGQSKGFCVVSLGSESSMRLCMDRLPKKELYGHAPLVTLPTKQALNQFESQQKTRPLPPQQNGPRGPIPNMAGMQQHPGAAPSGHQPRMMNPNIPQGQFRPQHMSQNMQGPQGPNQGPPRMQPPMHQGSGGPMGPQQQIQGPPRYQSQGQWSGPPRPIGPPRPGIPNGPSGPHQHRPQMFQGPPGPGMLPRGPRPDWNRPPMHSGFPQGPPGPQGHMQGPPRGPPPPQMAHGQGPAPHVNPAFFNQGQQHVGGPLGPPGPQPGMNMTQHGPAPAHFHNQQGAPRGPWPGQTTKSPGNFPEQVLATQLTDVEFEEIMARNRTVSSSAIARAVSDAAAGEYASAIETLVTAISLIKQSKVAHDERCKILISSLQDTLHGIEGKSYGRRERSRSRERSHRSRPRRERSTSRYRERSRERDRDREREREGRYHSDNYRESGRDRSRSRERARGGANDHYRDESGSRSARPRKSPEVSTEPNNETSKRSYYDDRYRSSDRERDRREEHRSRH